MSRFFIDHPIFAWVLAILLMLAGVLSMLNLPIEQYPDIAPPSVTVTAFYPGANTQMVENSVTQILEQQLTCIDNLRYINSVSGSDGSSTITLTFEQGTNQDIAQVQVQNKIQAALAELPDAAQRNGVLINKSGLNFLLVLGLYSEDGKVSQQELCDILASKMQDEISRINGVGGVKVFGSKNSMRIWLDPDRLNSYSMTPIDVYDAISDQNVDISMGQLGALPAVPGQELNVVLLAQSRFQKVEDFENIVLRSEGSGAHVLLKDVARVELGAESYNIVSRYNGLQSSALGINLASGANALQTADAVKAKVAELSQNVLPPGVKVVYPYDTTPFVRLSILDVVHTLIEAVILVFLIMYLFLQNMRATIVPTIAVFVVLLGSFSIIAACGFSINTLNLFAMVLAIGLLVDDAIVVVENVQRIMDEEGLSPREATRKSMGQITGALVGIAMVLSAVFVPMAFFSGSAGRIYRQFSITLISAMSLSVLVALILSPALCATILRSTPKRIVGQEIEKDCLHSDNAFFTWFNMRFSWCREWYYRVAKHISERMLRFFVVYGLLLAVLVALFMRLPSAFLPDDDQGIMFALLSAPTGATSERTLKSVKGVEDYLLNQEKDNVEHVLTITGYSFAGSAQNVGLGFIQLKDWKQRKAQSQKVFAISRRATGALSALGDASVFLVYPPPIIELGNSTGFDFFLEDRGGLGHSALMQARNQLLFMASKNPKLVAVRPNGLDDVSQFKVDIDKNKAKSMELDIADVNQTLQIAFGSGYVNDFINNGKVKKVYMQADSQYRMLPNDINRWYVRNETGKMVPLSAISSGRWTYGSPKLERFNGFSAVEILGAPAPGVSSGEAMQEVQAIVDKLPHSFALEWSGVSYEEAAAGHQTVMLYVLSVLVVLLCLAALYESWTIPLAVVLTVPIGVLGSVMATVLAGLYNDVYFQVALLTTIGLVAKNAILIIEFAKGLCEQGQDVMGAAMVAMKLRFRPIVMTSIAFILGVAPLVFASGAGSASQNAIGFGVMGGMIASATISILFVPMFFIAVEKIFPGKNKAN